MVARDHLSYVDPPPEVLSWVREEIGAVEHVQRADGFGEGRFEASPPARGLAAGRMSAV